MTQSLDLLQAELVYVSTYANNVSAINNLFSPTLHSYNDFDHHMLPEILVLQY